MYTSQCCVSQSLHHYYYTVPASQSEVTVMQSDDNQLRQDDESDQAEYTNGLYISSYMCVGFLISWLECI